MRFSLLLLTASLVANTALLGTHWVRSNDPSGIIAMGSQKSPASADAPPSAASPSAATIQSGTAEPLRNAWASGAASDVQGIKSRLEAAGYPADIVHSILMHLMQEQLDARHTALMLEVEEADYWEVGRTFSGSNSQVQAAAYELSREFDAKARDLFGGKVLFNEHSRRVALVRYGSLPDAKLKALQQIDMDYGRLRSDVLGTQGWTGSGSIAPANQEKLALLQREQQADIAALLTPEELFEFNVRSSPTASRLRSQLAGFNPTEEEFRAIFSVQIALDEQAGRAITNYLPPPRQTSDQRRAETQVLVEQLQSMLSQERLADLALASDPAHSTLTRLTTRLGLPLSAARELIVLQEETQPLVTAVRSNRELTPPQQQEQIRLLLEDATKRITETVGADGYEAYMEHGGQWLRSLQSRPAAHDAP